MDTLTKKPENRGTRKKRAALNIRPVFYAETFDHDLVIVCRDSWAEKDRRFFVAASRTHSAGPYAPGSPVPDGTPADFAVPLDPDISLVGIRVFLMPFPQSVPRTTSRALRHQTPLTVGQPKPRGFVPFPAWLRICTNPERALLLFNDCAASIADFCGCGICFETHTANSGGFGRAKPDYLNTVMLIASLFFRRVSYLRGFNIRACLAEDQPYITMNARLSPSVPAFSVDGNGELPPELHALRLIAELHGMPLYYTILTEPTVPTDDDPSFWEPDTAPTTQKRIYLRFCPVPRELTGELQDDEWRRLIESSLLTPPFTAEGKY